MANVEAVIHTLEPPAEISGTDHHNDDFSSREFLFYLDHLEAQITARPAAFESRMGLEEWERAIGVVRRALQNELNNISIRVPAANERGIKLKFHVCKEIDSLVKESFQDVLAQYFSDEAVNLVRNELMLYIKIRRSFVVHRGLQKGLSTLDEQDPENVSLYQVANAFKIDKTEDTQGAARALPASLSNDSRKGYGVEHAAARAIHMRSVGLQVLAMMANRTLRTTLSAQLGEGERAEWVSDGARLNPTEPGPKQDEVNDKTPIRESNDWPYASPFELTPLRAIAGFELDVSAELAPALEHAGLASDMMAGVIEKVMGPLEQDIAMYEAALAELPTQAQVDALRAEQIEQQRIVDTAVEELEDEAASKEAMLAQLSAFQRKEVTELPEDLDAVHMNRVIAIHGIRNASSKKITQIETELEGVEAKIASRARLEVQLNSLQARLRILQQALLKQDEIKKALTTALT